MFATLFRPSLDRAMRAVRIDSLEDQDRAFSWEDAEPVRPLPRKPFSFITALIREKFLGRLTLMVLAVVLGQTIEAFEPYALKAVVDALTAAADGKPIEGLGLTGWFLVLLGIWFGGIGMYRVYQVIDIYTSPSIRALAQKRMFAWLMGHSPTYFQDNFAGKLGQKIKQGANAILGIIEILMFDVIRVLVLLLVSLGLLWTASPFFSAILGVWMLAYVGVSAWLARHCFHLSEAMSDAVSSSSGRIVDAITNADLVRGFARTAFERSFLGHWINEERFRSRRLRWFLVLMRLFQMASIILLLAALIWLAIGRTLAGQMTVGEFTLVFTLAFQISSTVWHLSDRLLNFFEELGTLSEALEVISAPHEIVDAPGAKPLAVRDGGIEVKGLHFAFPDGTKVFQGLDLSIRPGEKVGLVGRSGAGKSTLVKLLRRQYEPQGGQILVDGQDIAFVTLESLNAAIAEVPQQPGVFHRSVGDNIAYGRQDAPQEMVEQAARQAHAHDFILRRPTAYGTIVGEQGIKLSGGERQRVAIARALLKDAKVLVLDEATSALDSESEHLIQEALWTLMEGRTVIAIAHRLSTITGMDRILYLEGGQVVEQGTHSQLLALGGRYAALWHRQSGGFLAAAE
ncbi:ABC transporter ATP-binding protein [Aerophototrophica crusticola]|uniref:ABC transporter ATP-binding protein n=1 Tax=Aerophototrophica crusticola TaxID=1709002 RepID=A0A858R578_9PROT|nr:ABC transporter ATP-binding protein [Rhodospirillaceae bacterium B3]